jgi:hypothetical protein
MYLLQLYHAPLPTYHAPLTTPLVVVVVVAAAAVAEIAGRDRRRADPGPDTLVGHASTFFKHSTATSKPNQSSVMPALF